MDGCHLNVLSANVDSHARMCPQSQSHPHCALSQWTDARMGEQLQVRLDASPRGGTSPYFQWAGSAPDNLRLCKNKESNRSKINEKGGQLYRKTKRKLMQNA